MSTIHLIDASPYIFRAYFALPDSIRDPRGNPAQAVYGFASFLLKLIADEKPTHLGITFDRSLNSSFRNELYPEYKQQRVLPPPELEAQLGACERIAAAMGGRCFIDDRYEADDLIATVMHQLRGGGHSFVIVTTDKDLLQLVSDDVVGYDFGKSIRYTPELVVKKFGVRPEQIVDYLALAGDAVDNIPGVKGIGGKTATLLLEAFGTLDAIYERVDEVAELPVRGAGSIRKKLESCREIAFLSQRLATVSTDAPIAVKLNDLEYRGGNPDEVARVTGELGFGGLRERIPLREAV
ncbi:MAG: 5'-3' exonuclease H3TH domain-containing protein [Thermoanaerobaculia bacterium]